MEISQYELTDNKNKECSLTHQSKITSIEKEYMYIYTTWFSYRLFAVGASVQTCGSKQKDKSKLGFILHFESEFHLFTKQKMGWSFE